MKYLRKPYSRFGTVLIASAQRWIVEILQLTSLSIYNRIRFYCVMLIIPVMVPTMMASS